MSKTKSTSLFANKVNSEENLLRHLSKSSALSVYNGNHPILSTSNAFQKRRKLELFIECTDLVQLDTFSKSDSMCVLYVRKLGQWTEYGRTESIPNSLQPKFVETFIIEANTTMYPRLRFSVFDLANFTSKDLRKHDFIGSVEIELENLLELESTPLTRTLRLPGDVKSRGYIYVYAEDVAESKTNVRLSLGASNLTKKGLLGKCDAFFEVNRLLQESGRFHPVYRSEVVTRTASPKWTPFDINLQKLCNDNVERQLMISCWNFSSSGNHSLVGEARVPVAHLLKRTLRQVDLVNPVKQQKSKRYSSSGVLRILHCRVDRQFSLLDYVRGNCVIRMVCAIDFTISNGQPLTQDSLHTIVEDKNEYAQTLDTVGKVLSSLQQEQKIAAYGFGAHTSSVAPLPYMFALDSENNHVELKDIEGVMDAYWKRLEDVKLGGPTYLAPVIRQIAAYANNEVSQSSQHYTIGLVVLDGIVNDVDTLVESLFDTRDLPLSIVVVGVGPADFKLMDELFSKNRRPLRSKEGKSCDRQNTDFLSLRRHAMYPGVNESMAREVFANISQQIVTFFKSRNIFPNPPTRTNVNEAWDETDNRTDLVSSRPSSSRMRKISQNSTARCPTCGSVLEHNNMLDTLSL